MRNWSLKVGDPLSLTLGADARLCQPDYVNDHIWELDIGRGEPAALAIRTTYGLRARSMRLFFRFGELGKTATNPAEFHTAPQLRHYYPNFLCLDFVPIEGLEVTAEYWVPESHVLAGRLTILNQTAFPRKLDFELCGVLTPLDGQSLAHSQQQMVNVLSGMTSGLSPVLFMTGGPKPGPGPHPSLLVVLDFEPGATRTLTWVLATEESLEESFELARQIAARPWEAERTRIELTDARDVLEIYTGDADWDAALAFSQRAALGLLYPGNEHLPHLSFVASRQPDGGFSHKGDGLDYSPAWSGGTPLEAYYLASLLPTALPVVRGLLENFFSVQKEDGFIDGRPGLSGQRTRLLAPPILASLAWKYYQNTEDKEFLTEAFSRLLAFFWVWFSPEHDRDRDGIPEWNHVLQTGFEDHPLFDVWHPWSQGMNISTLHSPELEAMLYHEASSLKKMAAGLDKSQGMDLVRTQAAALQSTVEASWNQRAALYTYRDRVTNKSLSGKVIARHKGPGNMRPRAEFEGPARLLVEVQTKNPAAQRPVVEIAEKNGKNRGETEVIQGEQFQWRSGGLVATTQKVFSKVGRVSVTGLDEKDKIIIRTAATTIQDMTLFTPLWAGIPSPEHAETLVKDSLFEADRFGRPFGIPALSFVPDPEADAVAMSVHLPWNHLIGEGLLDYGFRREAALLTTHLMNAVIQNLKQNHAFYENYHAETGHGMGERGALSGFAPVGLFLQTLGVTILSPMRVRLEGENPFVWPVTISYKGLKIVRGLENTQVVFPNGESIMVTDPAPCVVSL